MTDLVICEICGTTYESPGEQIDNWICPDCTKPAKRQKKEKKPSSTLENAIKRVLKGQKSKAITNVRECRCSLDKVIAGADEAGQRLKNLEVNGVKIIVHQLSGKMQITYEKDGQIFSGYYQ